MSGWQQGVEIDGAEKQPYQPPKGVIGVVVAQKFPDPEAIRTTLEEGIGRVAPDTVWVMREKPREQHAVTFAWRTFAANGIEPILAPLVPYWDTRTPSADLLRRFEERWPEQEWVKVAFLEYIKQTGKDMRPDMRDIEMRGTCERIIVFHDKSSNVTGTWLDYRDNNLSTAKIYVVERGTAKAKHRKAGRAPVGMADHRAVAARQRDEGIARVAAATPDEWKTAFETKAREIAIRRIEFTYEDIIRECPPPPGVKAQGCSFVMTRLRKEGVIEWTGRVVPATRLTRNVGDMKVWRGV